MYAGEATRRRCILDHEKTTPKDVNEYPTATELARSIREHEVSAAEVMEHHLERIGEWNPRINAIVTLLPEQAMERARAADEKFRRGKEVGPLHGLPVAHKDLVPTKGVRTTYGSSVYSNHVPDADALIVERLRKAGAITVGKTNTPEFGAGSQTFNKVFGATVNPYDTTKTCGGSSGGAAAALACGMLPIADGSDVGGSLRNPASFCNVVGMRPSGGFLRGRAWLRGSRSLPKDQWLEPWMMSHSCSPRWLVLIRARRSRYPSPAQSSRTRWTEISPGYVSPGARTSEAFQWTRR